MDKKLLRARNSGVPVGRCDHPWIRTLPSSGNESDATRMVKRGGDGQRTPLPPSPLTIEELQEGRLTEAAICAAAGTRRLENVTKLALVIDSSKTFIESEWRAMPRLQTLTLDGSRLVSFRDLGVGLRNLNTLSLESSGVKDLDGIAALSGLRELRLARNRVSDVTPLACHGNLQVLDLERNRISEVNSLDILATLPMLYSIDLRRNPLTDSLSNLRNGNGRGVVHKLIPQIRILDGVQLLANTSDANDVETLEEAIGLIQQGASQARDAWSEEDAMVEEEMTASDTASYQRQVKGKHKNSSMATMESSTGLATERRRSKAEVVGVERSPAISAVVVTNQEIVDWDSDLTQGGRQSFSGKPSSAIRRHKLARDIEGRYTRQSPTRILETLDMAKMMERGLKQRQGYDRLADWRREIHLDSLPQEDATVVIPEGLASRELRTRPPVGEIRNRISISPRPHERVWTGAGNNAQEAYNEASGKGTTGNGIAGELMFSFKDVTGDAAEEEMGDLLLRDKEVVSHRPWTTEQKLERSATTRAVASNQRRVPTPSARVSEHGLQTGGKGTPGGEAMKPRQGRQRPQTAPLLARRYDHEEQESQKMSMIWQPIWQSLQTSRLVSSSKASSLAKGSPPEQIDPTNRLDHIDFRRQRRARKARRRGSERKRGTDTGRRGGSENTARDSDSASGDDTDSGDDSGGSADDRDTIKKRAVDLLTNSAEELTPGFGTSNSWTISTQEKPKALQDKGSRDNQQHANAESQLLKANHETKNGVVASRRSLAAMDDSSESDNSSCGGSGDKKERKRSTCGSIARRTGDGGEGNPNAPASSISASLRLGFDLKKSLAAIDGWTEQVTTARDGCGAPQQAANENGQSILFFVQSDRETATSSCDSEKLHDKQSSRRQTKNFHGTNPCLERSAKDSVGSSLALTGCAKIDATGDSGSKESDEDGSEGEAILSVAAARAALGISKAISTTSAAAERDFNRMYGMTSPPVAPEGRVHRPSPAEIDALAGDVKIRITKASSKQGENETSAGPKSLASKTSSGLALGMPDKVLEEMLRRHPRTVPEIRTKGSFREFFRGMETERMKRLLKGAYEGTLPAGEVERKVKKRLGLVADFLT